MFAVYADRFSKDDPISALQVGSSPTPRSRGWTTVTVKAASLNHHDLFSLRGVGLREEALPMIPGCDAAGLDGTATRSSCTRSSATRVERRRDVRPEAVAALRAPPGHLRRPGRGAAANVVPKPASLSFEEAACLPTAWLTAYRMLFTRGELKPGETVLVQGAGGGVATAVIMLARAAGLRVLATSRDEGKRREPWRSARTGSTSPAPGCPSRSMR